MYIIKVSLIRYLHMFSETVTKKWRANNANPLYRGMLSIAAKIPVKLSRVLGDLLPGV